jgi:hypothetical protein
VRRLAIWLTVATIATSLVTLVTAPKATWKLPQGFRSPVLAAELVKDAAAIRMLYDDSSKFRRDLETNTLCDFLFIASYGSMFFVLGRIAGGKLGRVISWCAVGAMAMDVAENIGILRTFPAPVAPDALALSTRVPSLTKWWLLAVICLLLAIWFQNAHGDALRFVVGGLYLIAAAILAIGTARIWETDASEAFPALGLATVAQLVWLIRGPRPGKK